MCYKLDSVEGVEMLQRAYSKLDNEFLKERRFKEHNATERNPYHRDFTRILYSPSFRRLQGKMQILGVQNDAFFRNRLTHSLEVSQIARDIASKIGHLIGEKAYTTGNDLYVVEAAALAHDIGHPAFGHSGERCLDEICKENKIGRYEGNAQNFRILNHIEKKLPNEKGLNLTYRTLLAINKYIVKENSESDKFMFSEDYEFLHHIREKIDLLEERTLDVQIIDVADEIAYAVHDLEDGLSLGYFNIDELTYLLKLELKDKNPEIVEEFCKMVDFAKEMASKSNTYNTTQEYSQIFRKALVSKLTNNFIQDVGWIKIEEKNKTEHGTPNITYELGCCTLNELVHKLKKIIYKAVTRHDTIQLYEKRGSIVIKKLYEIYSDKNNNQLLTPDYRPNINYKKNELSEEDQSKLNRAAVDFISGMMDDFAKSMYKRYYNIDFDDIPINH